MQTLSSASRTCMASSSAVECTATDGTPSSLHARRTRSATSPRFAIRILSNISDGQPHLSASGWGRSNSLDDHQRLAGLYRLAGFDQNLDHRSAARGGDLIHGLHRLDDEQRVAHLHPAANLDEGPRPRLGPDIG